MISRRLVMHFSANMVDQPIVYRLVKEYGLTFNILKASISPNEEGILVCELTGKRGDYDSGIGYLRELGVLIQPLSEDVVRNEDRCTHCGACVVICPTGALHMDSETREVAFDSSKCIACEACIKPCPPRAMEIHF